MIRHSLDLDPFEIPSAQSWIRDGNTRKSMLIIGYCKGYASAELFTYLMDGNNMIFQSI
ncbi:hypothetical protein DESC_930035 [Desulfosarcina cetonica]|nr:hypothetical protein DESC_930035 [Desulfosarcina cetonica]